MTADSTPDSERPLESWKAIAAYLDRDPRTVRRWEIQEGLPIHRHQHASRSSVYAYPSELEAWRSGRTPAAAPPSQSWTRRLVALGAGLVLAVPSSGSSRAVAPAFTQAAGFTERVVDWPDEVPRAGAAISPDGRRVAYAGFPEGNGNLRVVDLTTGEGTFVTLKSDDDDGYTEFAQWSRDGAQIAYSWRDRGHGELRVVPSSSGDFRTLLRTDEPAEIYVYGWGPGNEWVLAGVGGFLPRTGAADTQQVYQKLFAVPVSGGPPRVLREFGPGPVGHTLGTALVSPDGRFVAYDFPRGVREPRAVGSIAQRSDVVVWEQLSVR